SARFHVLDELSVILGARTTNWVSNKTTTPYATGIAAKNNRAETGEVTPYAAVVYDIDDHWSAYASYTDIFKPQSNRDVDGNFLDPLLGSSYEIGAKAEFFDQRLNFAAAVFKIDQDNLAVSTGVTGP